MGALIIVGLAMLIVYLVVLAAKGLFLGAVSLGRLLRRG